MKRHFEEVKQSVATYTKIPRKRDKIQKGKVPSSSHFHPDCTILPLYCYCHDNGEWRKKKKKAKKEKLKKLTRSNSWNKEAPAKLYTLKSSRLKRLFFVHYTVVWKLYCTRLRVPIKWRRKKTIKPALPLTHHQNLSSECIGNECTLVKQAEWSVVYANGPTKKKNCLCDIERVQKREKREGKMYSPLCQSAVRGESTGQDRTVLWLSWTTAGALSQLL